MEKKPKQVGQTSEKEMHRIMLDLVFFQNKQNHRINAGKFFFLFFFHRWFYHWEDGDLAICSWKVLTTCTCQID